MTDAERMLLEDAIEIAIEADKERIVWKRVAFIFGCITIVLVVTILGGYYG